MATKKTSNPSDLDVSSLPNSEAVETPEYVEEVTPTTERVEAPNYVAPSDY